MNENAPYFRARSGRRNLCFLIILFGFSAVLTVLGNINLMSATFNSKFIQLPENQRQWSVACFAMSLLTFFFLKIVKIEKYLLLLYFSIVASLGALFIFGEEISGAIRWFETPFGSLQPSEISKPIFILVLSILFSRLKPGLILLAIPLLLTLSVTGLVFFEPDFGTSLVFIFIFFILYWVNERDKIRMLKLLLLFTVLGLILWVFGLKDYQRDRIVAFLDPEKAPDTYYHTQQSITMVGSGGVYGKGYMRGPGNIYGYIPADHTDFVLAVFAEEYGFTGMGVFFGIWAVFLCNLLFEAVRLKGIEKNIMVGVFAVFFFQSVLNMAMVLGLAPVTGIPLPFFTYGGSSMITNGILLGMAAFAWSRE